MGVESAFRRCRPAAEPDSACISTRPQLPQRYPRPIFTTCNTARRLPNASPVPVHVRRRASRCCF